MRRAYRAYFGGVEQDSVRSAHLSRLVRVAWSVVLARELLRFSDEQGALRRLRALESRNPIREMRGT